MKRRGKVHAKIVTAGVDIIDRDGSMLAGIVESDAINLYKSLRRLMPRIKKRLPSGA